jgi:hypothetical protein
VLLALVVLYVGACTFNRHRLQARFETVAMGASATEMAQTMGLPDEFDSDVTVNALYASRPCEAPCVRRAWYYNRFEPEGIEAWSFELDRDDRVVGAAHWLLP